jgi:ribonuclease M5
MKKKISGVIVVEGAMDIAFLSNFIDSEFVSVNGSAIDKNVVRYLQSLPASTPIYLLLDPDSPGEKIRHTLHQQLNHYTDVFVPKAQSIKGKKVGVAESNKQTILDAFAQSVEIHPKHNEPTISIKDLVSLQLTGSENATVRRRLIEQHFHLGFTNTKTLLKRLNQRQITLQQMMEILS